MKILAASFLILFSLDTVAEYNVKCSAPKICQDLYNSLQNCEGGSEKSCSQYADLYKKALPKYDCQPKEAKPSDNYVIPAIWICDNHEYLLNSLSKMTSIKAKKLYGSAKLRSTLDGALGEDHRKKSIAVGKIFEKKIK